MSRAAQGSTPLHWAAYFGHERVVVALLDAGADASAANAAGLRPADVCRISGPALARLRADADAADAATLAALPSPARERESPPERGGA